MAQSGTIGVFATPQKWDISIATASASGVINVGDWLAYSGQAVVPAFATTPAYWKLSGAGIALESNSAYDQAGRLVANSALKYLVEGIVIVSASFSGEPPMGLGAYPDATGSGVAAPTGQTGVGATWNTAQVINGSAYSGTAIAPRLPVATVIGSLNFGNAGTGQMVIRLSPLAPDVRG